MKIVKYIKEQRLTTLIITANAGLFFSLLIMIFGSDFLNAGLFSADLPDASNLNGPVTDPMVISAVSLGTTSDEPLIELQRTRREYTPNIGNHVVELVNKPIDETVDNTLDKNKSTEPDTTTGEQTSGNTIKVYITYYGWHDNDPAGRAIAYPSKRYSETLHNEAGGTGTYSDPITFATDPKLYKPGTILYVPYIKKYIIMEDMCAGCINNWQNNNKKHIDIWMESDEGYENELYQCQRNYTRSSIEIEVDPPKDLNVDKTPLFNVSNGKCL